jgi:hypothetical protein
MRIFFCSAVIALASLAMALGQETNFASGPQYLMTHGSSLFARPISTPSMSLSGPPLEVGATNASAGLTAGADNHTVTPRSAADLPFVDFFPIYYGVIPVSVIEISFVTESERSSLFRELPSSILDTGVWQVTTAQALRERGYGVTLAEGAEESKARVRHATHVYTNADVDRLHKGS